MVDKTQFLVPAIRDHFAARLMALPTVNPGEGLPRNDQAAPLVINNTRDTGYRDSGAESQAVYAVFPTDNYASEISVGSNASGTSRYFAYIQSNGSFQMYKDTGGSTDELTPFSFNAVKQPNKELRLGYRKLTDTTGELLVIFDATTVARRQVEHLGGTYARMRVDASQGPTSIGIGSLNPRLAIETLAYASGARRPVADLAYTTLASDPAAPSGFEVQIEKGNGAVVVPYEDTDVLSVISPGKVRVQGRTVVPDSERGTDPVFRFRQKNFTAAVAQRSLPMPGRDLLIGSNVVAGRTIYNNLCNSADWQNVNNYNVNPQVGGPEGIDLNGEVTNAPSGSRLRMNLKRPPIEHNDADYELSWTQGDSGQGSTWSIAYDSYNQAGQYPHPGTQLTAIGPITFSNGKYRQRVHYNADLVTPNTGLFIASGSGNMQNLTLMPVGVADTLANRFSSSWLAFIKQLPGHIRHMETMNSNNWDRPYGFSNRARRRGLTGIAPDGMPVEDIIYIHNETNRPVWICIAYTSPQDYVTKFIRALLTGEGTEDGIGLKPGVEIIIELVGNEPWNPGLTGLYFRLRSDGWADPEWSTLKNPDGSNRQPNVDGNGARLFMQAKRHNQVYDWIMAAVPEAALRARLVPTISVQPDNGINDYTQMRDSFSIRGVGGCARSIYHGIDCTGPYASNAPADLSAAFLADADKQFERFLQLKPMLRADGVRDICYEIGIDNTAVPNFTGPQRETFANSTEGKAAYRKLWNRVRNEAGDVFCIYYDTGPYADGGFGGWSHHQGDDAVNGKWDVIMEQVALLNPP